MGRNRSKKRGSSQERQNKSQGKKSAKKISHPVAIILVAIIATVGSIVGIIIKGYEKKDIIPLGRSAELNVLKLRPLTLKFSSDTVIRAGKYCYYTKPPNIQCIAESSEVLDKNNINFLFGKISDLNVNNLPYVEEDRFFSYNQTGNTLYVNFDCLSYINNYFQSYPYGLYRGVAILKDDRCLKEVVKEIDFNYSYYQDFSDISTHRC